MAKAGPRVAFWICVVIFVSLFVAAFVKLAQFMGDKDNWNDIQTQLSTIAPLIIVGTIAFTVAILFYISQNPTYAIYLLIVISCMSLGLSYGALVVGSMTR